MKKILFVNGHLNVGGVEKSLFDILRNFDYSQYEVDLLLLDGLGDYSPQLPKEVNIIYIDSTKIYGPFIKTIFNLLIEKDFKSVIYRIIIWLSQNLSNKFLVFLRYLFKLKKNYDCAIAFRVGYCADIVAYSVKSHKKICWWHNGDCSYNQSEKKHIDKTFSKLNKIVSVSNSIGKLIENNFVNVFNKIIVIPNMIDINYITTKSNESINNEFCSLKSKHIITVSRISKEKNTLVIVDVVKELLNLNFNEFVWNIVGTGDEFNNLKESILSNNLSQYINLLGNKKNPYPYIKHSDIMVHTSLVESQCLSVLEAMALNVPCIVTKSIGPQEFISSYENGILTSFDAKDIAQQIIAIFNNENLKLKIEKNSRNIVEKNYSVNTIMQMIYNQIN